MQRDEPGAAERFHDVFRRVGVGVAVADANGCLLEANPAFCETIGYTPDELASADVMSLIHPEDRPQLQELAGQLFDGRRDTFTLESRYLARDDRPVWVRATFTRLDRPDGGEPQLIATTEDISAQRAAEARLEASEALLRIAGRVGRVGGWAIDTDPVKLYWSDEVHDMAGYPRGQTPPLDEAFALHPDGSRERMAAAVERCIEQGVPFDLEERLEPPRADPLWVRVVGEPLWGADGRVTRIQGAIMDVSEQKQARLETAELAERLTTTMESITDALYTIDTSWRFTYLNRRAQELLERDAADLIGRTVWETFPATVGSPLETAFRRAASEGRTVVLDEYYYSPFDRYFAVNAYPSEQGLAVYFRDVTAERATRVELQERGARLAEQATLLDEAQDAIIVRGLDGRISFWNRSAERIYGWSAIEASGAVVDELLHLDDEVVRQATDRLFAEGSFVGEIAPRAKDGRELVVEARWTLVRRGGDDEPASVLAIETDITERKRMEHQFLRSQRMESIGKLAGGIAHDLNNVLAPISVAIGLLRDDETDELKLRMLDVIESSARHGADMVEQVLSFARGVDGRRVPIAVGDIVEEVRSMSGDTFPKNIVVESDVDPDLWPVVGDPTQIQQVLVNLCVNARDAMPHGGRITLEATNAPPRGPSTHQADGSRSVVLRVSDTGGGIPDDIVDRVFDPFFTTKPQGEGTGLGLSTSAVIVSSHGGRLDVTSTSGAGTTFEIQLPADPAAIDSGHAVEPPIRRGEGELLLVVDDEEAVREVARTMLERSGYHVLTAGDGREALASFEQHRRAIAVVLTDLVMPGMDGYATISAIRRSDGDVPIIASTGLTTTDATDRSLEAGATVFLAKPYDAPALLRVVGDLLPDRRAVSRTR